jgi:hypothetical protein
MSNAGSHPGLHHAGRPDQYTCQQTGPEELKNGGKK